MRIARYPQKGGKSNRNSGPTVGEVTQTALSQAKRPVLQVKKNPVDANFMMRFGSRDSLRDRTHA